MAYKLPKGFKPAAALDSCGVDESSLSSKHNQLWHFTFPLDFNVELFSELELHLPAEPLSSASQVPQMVASFELEGQSYRIIEGSVFETYDLVNLFPKKDGSNELVPGKPFTRSFRICRDVLFPAPPKPAPLNPRGRAPNQLQGIVKNMLPLGYQHESLGTKQQEGQGLQGRVLRSTSARPQSPRLFAKHGFDVREMNLPQPATKGASAAASSSSSAADEAARREAKKQKKEAKKRAAEAGVSETPSKKARTADAVEGEKSAKKKKSDKHKQ